MSVAAERAAGRSRVEAPINGLEVSAFEVPTDVPESDGTLAWDSTTIVTVELSAGGERGLGFTYGSAATGRVIADELAPVVIGRSPLDVPAAWDAAAAATRNLGRPGVGSMAIAALDVALWDLKGRLLGLPTVDLWGRARTRVAIYGSGGFTSYSIPELQRQLAGWVESGIGAVKLKVGREPERDAVRVEAARDAVGPETALMVDANGAYDRKQALAIASELAAVGVTWLEEPVSSDDLAGLRMLRDRAPAGLEIAAGEYAYDAFGLRALLDAGAVDVLQADVTRCGGFTGFLRADALCQAHCTPLSAHTAPALHAHVGCAAPAVRHVEWFHDHARVERLLFDGVPSAEGGEIAPDRSRPGIGLELKRADAARYEL